MCECAVLTLIPRFRSFPNFLKLPGAKWRWAPWCRRSDRDCPRTTTSRRGTSRFSSSGRNRVRRSARSPSSVPLGRRILGVSRGLSPGFLFLMSFPCCPSRLSRMCSRREAFGLHQSSGGPRAALPVEDLVENAELYQWFLSLCCTDELPRLRSFHPDVFSCTD